MRKIALRIDDVTAGMDWESFQSFAQLLDRHRICPLIGVVPDCQDPMLNAAPERQNRRFQEAGGFGAWLRERQEAGWSIAVHGCYHLYTTKRGGLFPLNRLSEYAGLPYETQKKLLADGRARLLELGIDTDIFMAPAHSYDRTTLRALVDTGYRYVTDGYGSRPYERDGLIFLPIAFLRSREKNKRDGFTTYVVHTWELEKRDLDWYEELFTTRRVQIIDYRELLETEPVRRGLPGTIGEYLMASGKRIAGSLGGG